ncbi:MAG: (S)-ureidoglycine aminohydrolase [Solirubrobacteraceae bacterium]
MSFDRPRSTQVCAAFRGRGYMGGGYHLITEANRAPSVLPELRATTVHKLVTPRRAPARFAQYLLRIEPGGGTVLAAMPTRSGLEHFLYGLEGEVRTTVDGTSHTLTNGRFAFLAQGHPFELRNASESTALVIWIKRRFEPAAGLETPASVAGDRADIPESEYEPGLWRTELIAASEPRHDFTIIRMRFEPGVELAMVELHEEEHGLYVTAGRGRYLLGEDQHDVQQSDFIYMAPYCPQSFIADAVEGAEYLLYKDVCRDGF